MPQPRIRGLFTHQSLFGEVSRHAPSHASVRHILPAPVFAYAKPLSGPAIRIKQPERYVSVFLNLLENR
jgi:hypothetical protein